MSRAMNIQTIIERVDNGEPLTTPQLEKAIKFYSQTADNLAQLGPTFHLAWKEVYFTLNRLEGFLRNRERR